MSQREILTNGNAFKRTDGRWGGTVWYLDEKGERKRKSFSGTTKAEVNKNSSSLPWREPPMTELKASRKIKSILGSARRSSATLPPRISKSCSITG